MLTPILDPFDGPPQPHGRETDQKILGIELAAAADPSAGVALLQAHRGGAAAEHAGQGVPIAMRHLGRTVELQYVARVVVTSKRAARLDRHRAVPADGQVEFHDGMRRGEGNVDLAKPARKTNAPVDLAAGEFLGGASSATTGASSSASIVTTSAASSARYASVANTTATGSPTYRSCCCASDCWRQD